MKINTKITLSFIISDLVINFITWLFLAIYIHIYFFEFLSNSVTAKVTESLFIAFIWTIIYYFSGAYINIARKSRLKELFNIMFLSVIGVFFICALLAPLNYRIDGYKNFFKIYFSYLSIQFLLIVLVRMILMTYVKSFFKTGKILFNTIIIGTGKNAIEILTEIKKIKHSLGWNVIGNLYVNPEKQTLNGLNMLGNITNLEHIINISKVEQVVIAVEPDEHEYLSKTLEILDFYDINVSIIPELEDIIIGSFSINYMFKLPLIEIRKDIIPHWQKTIKRTLDIIGSFSFIFLGSPFLLVFSLITKFTSAGPIFFRQERIGQNGHPFKIYKFRSMYVNAEQKGPALSSKNDKRITPWGAFMRKTRIDELPQFYNVLIGDMSLVGPRPERQFYIDQIVKVAPNFKLRQKVKPGITSLAQVKYGYAENVDEMIKRLKYDIFYIKNMSLYLDFVIIYLTIITVLRAEGK